MDVTSTARCSPAPVWEARVGFGLASANPAVFVNQALIGRRRTASEHGSEQPGSLQNAGAWPLPVRARDGAERDAADLSNPDTGRLNNLSSRRLHSAALTQFEVQ